MHRRKAKEIHEPLVEGGTRQADLAAEIVDQFFVKHPKHKGKFALALALLIDKNLNSVVVPSHIGEMFTWLYDGTEPNSTPVDDLI